MHFLLSLSILLLYLEKYAVMFVVGGREKNTPLLNGALTMALPVFHFAI